MDFGEKLKQIRKEEGLSQEQLAEKIGVSRQAITKWETGKGLPDVENMIILAEIFKITLDELVSQAKPAQQKEQKAFESETIYDIDCSKDFDIHLGSVGKIVICSGKDEKLHVKLESETLENLNSLFKIKLDETRKKLDVDCVKKKGISRYETEASVAVTIILPEEYTNHCELEANTKELYVTDLNLNRLEYDGGAERVIVRNCNGSVELTSKTDYDITIEGRCKRLEVNQWKSRAIVHIPESSSYKINNKGRRCEVYYEKNGTICELPIENEGENEICISGVSSELIVDYCESV